jgi:excinuclease ABC subunit C
MKRERVYNSLKEKIKLLPKLPGVYRFTDKEGKIIYIGKAKSLRNRVSQYFNSPEGLSGKTRVMVSRIADIHHTVVENEGDALLLENNLIKEYQPRYNVMLKDGKTYPWICIKNEPFPRVFITRRVVKDGSLYFGPYSSALHAHNLVALVSELFYLRDCKLSLTKESIERGKYKPCLKYHINKCKAPCAGLFSEEQYNRQIEQIKSLLKGDTSTLVREFREKMNEAASLLKYEEAHSYKEKIDLIKNHNNKSVIVNHKISNIDVFTLVFSPNTAHGNYIRIVNGRIIQSLNMEFKIPLEETPGNIMSLFISDTHTKFGDTSREILVNHYPDSGHIEP